MRQRIFWSALVAIAFLSALFEFFEPVAYSQGSRAPKTIRAVAPPPTGVDSGNCSGTPCATIQYAINQSSYGDQINIASGTFTEHIVIKNGVSIHGQGWSSTIINGHYASSVSSTVTIPGTVDATTIISGVQVTGGGTGTPNTSPHGGGIYIVGSPSIINTWVYSCTGNYGGGVYIGTGSPTLNNVSVWNSRGVYGGGFYLTNGAQVTIVGNPFDGTNGTVLWNFTDGYGGGFYISGATITMTGVRAYWNKANYGSGMYIYNTPNSITLIFNDISENSAIWYGGGIFADNSTNLQIALNWINANNSIHGAGTRFLSSSGLLQGNLFKDNKAIGSGAFGGGVEVVGASAGMTIDGNWFEGNWSDVQGSAVGLGTDAVALLNANTIVTNTAYAGALSLSNTGPTPIHNNIIARNVITPTSAATAGGIIAGGSAARIINNTIAHNAGDGIYFYNSEGITITNNIIHENYLYGINRSTTTAYLADYNNVFGNAYYGLPAGSHDLSVYSDFVVSGDIKAFYHLLPTSPVSKTGSLNWLPPKARDIDGDARVLFNSMGADQVPIPIRNLFLPLIVR